MLIAKRGQITVFIILGFILLFAVYLAILAEPFFSSRDSVDSSPVELLVRSCTRDAVLSFNRVVVSGDIVSSVRRQFEEHVQSSFVNCVDFTSQGLEVVELGSPFIELQFTLSDVVAHVEYPLKVRSRTSSQKFERFSVTIPSRISLLMDVASRLQDVEADSHVMDYTVTGASNVALDIAKLGIRGSFEHPNDGVKVTGQDISDISVVFEAVVKGGTFVRVTFTDLTSGLSLQLMHSVRAVEGICDIVSDSISVIVRDSETKSFLPASVVFDCVSYSCPLGRVAGKTSFDVPQYCGRSSLVVEADGYVRQRVAISKKIDVLLDRIK